MERGEGGRGAREGGGRGGRENTLMHQHPAHNDLQVSQNSATGSPVFVLGKHRRARPAEVPASRVLEEGAAEACVASRGPTHPSRTGELSWSVLWKKCKFKWKFLASKYQGLINLLMFLTQEQFFSYLTPREGKPGTS